ncbi:uncharacterized protein N7529_008884 [Penicillium soppii]|uniref:uncharacterized protein n=1 Tax=Penicillium soppii TaxID=69789 RepID=UPI0025487F81|nr:uncharacterized protein N7529_008884 [Penicillium soppii]KAJ5861574.1 hypothetical protein N7529_008884 [Penicillium soppii]
MKFTIVFGVAALFMAPSAVAWKLPNLNKVDIAATPTEQSAPSGATPAGGFDGFPGGGYPSGFPSGTGFPSGLPSGSPSGHHHHHGHGGPHPTGAPSGMPSGFPEGPSPTGGFQGGEAGGEGSFTILPSATPTPGAVEGEEQEDFRRLHARQIRPVVF